jgi:hypothetical protein
MITAVIALEGYSCFLPWMTKAVQPTPKRSSGVGCLEKYIKNASGFLDLMKR